MQRRDLMQALLVSAAPPALAGRASADEPQNAGAVPDARLTAPLTVPASGDINVAFLVSEGAEVVDFSGPWGVFEYVLLGDDYRWPFKLYTVAATREPVEVSGGMTLVPDHTFADAPAPNIVVVPAMNIDRLAPAALDWLRAAHRNTHVTMSVCNGSFVLARAGLLDGKTVTAHHGGYGRLRAAFPSVNVIRGVRYVEDGKIATSGGLTSGVDLAMRVVERYFGRDEARRTARRLEYQGTGWMYPQSNSEFAARPVGTAERPICPVCEMQIRREAALTHPHQGRTYYFCSDWCKDHFVATPSRFI
jgi:transcriptional regulator GlxA family with amidase domain/YHS domain-containing protein